MLEKLESIMGTTFQRLQVALGVRDVEASMSFYRTLGFAALAQMGEPPTLTGFAPIRSFGRGRAT